MRSLVFELLVGEVAAAKLSGRGISKAEVEQLLHNAYTTVRNSGRGIGSERRLLIGRTDGGRVLTLVIERTEERATWLVVTGWTAAAIERKMLAWRW